MRNQRANFVVPWMLLFVASFSPAHAANQQSARTPQEKADALKKMSADELVQMLESGADRPAVIHRLRKLRARKAGPQLRKAFEEAKLDASKRSAAAALIALGDGDEVHWKYLSDPAEAAIDRDIPWVTAPDGKSRSPEFIKWCEAHGRDVGKTTELVVQEDPQKVLALSLAESKRAAPILMRGLRSRNPLVVNFSARGLAALRHGPAIKEITAATEKRADLGKYLLLFDDKGAEDAARRLMPPASFEFLKGLSPEKRREAVLGE